MEYLIMQSWNKSLVFFIIVLAGLMYLLAPILTPFLTGAILAYLVNPAVNALTRLRLPRLTAVIIVFVALFAILLLLILLLIPLIEGQLSLLADTIPTILGWLQERLVPTLSGLLGTEDIININMIKTTLAQHWAKAPGVASVFLNTIVHSGFVLAAWLINLFLIPVVTFYLLCDWNKLIRNIRALLPRTIENTAVKLFKECDEVLSAFFRGQLLVMLSLGTLYGIGLTVVGLRIGLILGLIIGLMSIIPYLGMIVGVTIATIAAYVQFGSIHPVLLIWLVFIIGQVIESTLLTPNLIGDRIGLHPVAVIFAILAGGNLFGFFGVLLALPTAAVIMVWLRFLNERYHASRYYK
jgi:predicted PurR-regulated permease PerM